MHKTLSSSTHTTPVILEELLFEDLVGIVLDSNRSRLKSTAGMTLGGGALPG
jgi:hypothetical protein